MPRVDAPTPETTVPARLFYRAYDVGIEFDENYVDLMYRLGAISQSIFMTVTARFAMRKVAGSFLPTSGDAPKR